jgi:hypothetical protein
MQPFFDLPSSTELSPDLEWMLQGDQADDATLAMALIREYYTPLQHLFSLVFDEPFAIETCLELTFALAVARRHTYRAAIPVSVWFYAQALRVFRGYRHRQRFQRWKKRLAGLFQKPSPNSAMASAGPEAIWLEAFRHLGEENRLLVALHLGVGFSSNALAKVYKQPEEVVQGLIMTNLTYLLFRVRRTNLHEKQNQVEHFRERLTSTLQNTQAGSPLNDARIHALAAQISSPAVQQPQRAVARSIKELALGGAVILVVFALWLLSGVLDGSMENPLSTVAANLNPSATPYATRTLRPTYAPRATRTATPENSATPAPAIISTASRSLRHDFSSLTMPKVILADPFGVNTSGSLAVSLVLQSWGWPGDANRPSEVLQPNPADHTVLAYEILEYINRKTEFSALLRLDGDIGLMCALAEAGYPVIVQRAVTLNQLHAETPETLIPAEVILLEEGISVKFSAEITQSIPLTATPHSASSEWYATYEVLTGCNEHKMDIDIWRPSVAGVAQYRLTTWEFDRGWWAFGNQYLLIYPRQRETDVLAILAGKNQEYARDNSDEQQNFINAVETTSYRVYSASNDLERFYAWFNRGTALTYLDDYIWAADAFDTAFEIYAQIPAENQPRRMMWYNTRPYWAYFYIERYQDVIDLATTTLEAPGGSVLEESYYWRALAREALGDLPGALADMEQAVELNRFFTPAIEQLAHMKQ